MAERFPGSLPGSGVQRLEQRGGPRIPHAATGTHPGWREVHTSLPGFTRDRACKEEPRHVVGGMKHRNARGTCSSSCRPSLRRLMVLCCTFCLLFANSRWVLWTNCTTLLFPGRRPAHSAGQFDFSVTQCLRLCPVVAVRAAGADSSASGDHAYAHFWLSAPLTV